MILLDTPTIAAALKPSPCPTLQAWLNEQVAETLFISSVTIAEFLALLNDLQPDTDQHKTLNDTLDGLLEIFNGRVLPFDTDAARCYASLPASHRIPPAQGYIVATALVKGFSLATRDTAIYEASGVVLLNPWEEAHDS